MVKTVVPRRMRMPITQYVRDTVSAVKVEKVAMPEKTKGYLINYYTEDIAKLSNLLNKDLSVWLQ